MPGTTAAERQKLLLQQEIAKLSGAISSRSSQPAAASSSRHASSYHPYRGSSRGRGTYNSYHSSHGYSRGGSSARGRGGTPYGAGGNSHSLDLRGKNAVAKQPTAASSAGSIKTAANGTKEDGEMSPSPPPADLPAAGPSTSQEGPGFQSNDSAQARDNAAEGSRKWYKTTQTGNMSLMTAEKRQALKSLPRPVKTRKPHVPPSVQVLSSTTDTSGQKVVIDGVIFQFEPGGTKLTRIGEVTANDGAGSSNGSQANTPTRRKVAYAGRNFRRTSRGNLISSKPEKQRTFCRYYTRTGKCDRALTCPYQHSPSHRSICPSFLRGTCAHMSTPETCLLSHEPSAHNTPSCLHFQASSYCRKGDECPYPHVKTGKDAQVCSAFAQEGWCEKDPGTCRDVHCWECPEFRSTGKCSKNGKCGLRHVLRAGGKASGEAAEMGKQGATLYKDVKGDLAGESAGSSNGQKTGGSHEGEGAFDDGSTFIGLPGLDDDEEQDHGFPLPLGEISGEDDGLSQDEDGDLSASEDEDDEGDGSDEDGGQESEDVDMDETGVTRDNQQTGQLEEGSDDESESEADSEDDVLGVVH